jgi:N-acetylglutamate synthase
MATTPTSPQALYGSLPVEIREFVPSDYDRVMAIWHGAHGVTLRDVDAREPLSDYLVRHRGLCFVATDGDEIVGAVLCGTDGRRGYLSHLAVAESCRRRGIGRRLAEACVAALHARGIQKCHLMVRSENAAAQAFWSHLGWVDRADVRLMSFTATDSGNA